jgi:hypothetical protein
LVLYIGLDDVFEDFKHDRINMSLVHSFIGQTLAELDVPVFATPRKVFEKVNVHRLRYELAMECHHVAVYAASLLGSALSEQGVKDSLKIARFVRGDADKYDNIDYFDVIYDFKYLTMYAGARYVVPLEILRAFTPKEWKSGSVSRELTGKMASTFSAANKLSRLHISTTLCVDLCEFAFDVDRLQEVQNAVRDRVGPTIQNVAPREAKQKTESGRIRAEFWDRLWAEIGGRLLEESLLPKTKRELRVAIETIAAELEIEHGETAMQRPTKLLWDRIAPEIGRIYGIADDEN